MQQITHAFMTADFTVYLSWQVGQCNPAVKLPGRPDVSSGAGVIATLSFLPVFSWMTVIPSRRC
jgi:hypothetical protein